MNFNHNNSKYQKEEKVKGVPTSLHSVKKDAEEDDQDKPDLELKIEIDKIKDLKNILFLKGKSISDTK